jgi:uncharacterized membrane protein YedE/YeeE
MEHFTPISAAIGGLLIGLSAILFLYLNGRIAGISGIFHGLAFSARNEFSWRILFILGLVTGCTAYYFIPVIQFIPRSHYPRYLLILSGILVSVGTKLGGGCTSGHGVCGLARLSLRSLVATIIFICAGVLSTYIIRHVIHL